MKNVSLPFVLALAFLSVSARAAAQDLHVTMSDQTRRVVLKEAFPQPGEQVPQPGEAIHFMVSNNGASDEFVLSAFIDSDTEVTLVEVIDQKEQALAVFSRTIPLRRLARADQPFAAALHVPRGQSREYMVFFSDTGGVRLELWARDAFFSASTGRRFLLGLFYGAIALLVLSQLGFALVLRDACYLWFSLFMLAVCAALAYWDGTALVTFHPRSLPASTSMYFFNFANLGLAAFYMFLRGFLGLRHALPRLGRAALALAGLHAALSAAQVLAGASFFPQAVSALGLVLCAVTIAACLHMLRAGYRPALFLLIGFTVQALTILIACLQLFGILLGVGFSSVLYYPATLALAVLLTAALGDRVRLLRADSERTARLNAAMGDFFANLSHELRTPLMLISTYLDAYAGRVPPSRELQVIRRNVGKLARNVSQFFDVLRFEKGSVPEPGGAALLTEIVRERLAVFAPTAAQARLRLESDLEEGIVVAADDTAVECIVDNLVDNALKYNREGGEVRVQVRGEAAHARLLVRDTGAGIPADQLSNIFRPYFQIARPKLSRQGIGMGLCLVKRTVESLGGTIDVESTPGEGSVFSVRLPRAAAASAAARPAPAESPLEEATRRHELPSASASAAPSAKAETAAGGDSRAGLLVVEDNDDLRELLAERFSPLFRVRTACNGAEALRELAGMDNCSAIVSDLMMDGVDGSQLLEALRANPRYAEIPVMLITAKAEPEDRMKLLARGAADYVVKPFNVEELGLKLLTLTRRFEAERRRQEAEHRQRLELMLGELSHEIKNPLSGITGPAANLRLLLAGAAFQDRERAEKYVGLIERNSARIARLLSDVNALLSRRELASGAVAIPRLLREVAGRCAALHPGVRFSLGREPRGSVRGDEAAAARIFENVFMNAAEAMEGKGTIGVEVTREGAETEIRVRDSGPGIPEENLARLFDPFFTTKPVGKGMGLGLAVAKDLAAAMGWRIEAAPRDGPGACFVIRAPAA